MHHAMLVAHLKRNIKQTSTSAHKLKTNNAQRSKLLQMPGSPFAAHNTTIYWQKK